MAFQSPLYESWSNLPLDIEGMFIYHLNVISTIEAKVAYYFYIVPPPQWTLKHFYTGSFHSKLFTYSTDARNMVLPNLEFS